MPGAESGFSRITRQSVERVPRGVRDIHGNLATRTGQFRFPNPRCPTGFSDAGSSCEPRLKVAAALPEAEQMGFFSFINPLIGIAEAATGIDIPFLGPRRSAPVAQVIPRSPTPRAFPIPSRITNQPVPGSNFGGPCGPGFEMRGGRCVARLEGVVATMARAIPGGQTGFGAVGEPFVQTVQRRQCPRRHVLGADGLCYPKRGFKNADRWWPAPRKPLLTGGDLNAIATAARAAKRLTAAQKRLQKMGMLPKPAPRRSSKKGHQHHVVSGGTLRVIEEVSN